MTVLHTKQSMNTISGPNIKNGLQAEIQFQIAHPTKGIHCTEMMNKPQLTQKLTDQQKSSRHEAHCTVPSFKSAYRKGTEANNAEEASHSTCTITGSSKNTQSLKYEEGVR